MSLKNQKNSRKQGDVGLGSAISYFCANEWNVCIPLTDSQAYDLIVEKDSVIKRVQVKTTWSKTSYGIYQVTLKTSGGNKSRNTVKTFDPSSVELLFVLTDDGDRYLIPCTKDMPANCLNLGKQYEEFIV